MWALLPCEHAGTGRSSPLVDQQQGRRDDEEARQRGEVEPVGDDADEHRPEATCGSAVPTEDARRRETMGDLDPTKWQTFCCPDCGCRLKTVFVGNE